jgi:hypothetical protein
MTAGWQVMKEYQMILSWYVVVGMSPFNSIMDVEGGPIVWRYYMGCANPRFDYRRST